MTDLVDPLVQAHDDLGRPPTRARSGHPGLGGRMGLSLLVMLGLAALLLGVALLTGVGNRLRHGVAAEILSGDSLQAAGEYGWVSLMVGDEIPDGAPVRTGESDVRLRFRDGQIWLGPGAAAKVFSDRLDLIRGEAMVASHGTLGARWTDITVSGRGIFRLTPGVNPQVGVYRGSVRVRRPAQSRLVRSLEQLGLSGRHLPVESAPLAYRAEDPWDRELLGQAMAFDGEVERITRGIDVRFTLEPKPPEFYRGFEAVDEATIPILKSAARTVSPDGRFGPASDALVALFVAQAAADATTRPLATTAMETAQWRVQGARWGLVAMRFGITASDFAGIVDLSRIDQLARARLQLASPTRPALSGVQPATAGVFPRPPAAPSTVEPASAEHPEAASSPPPSLSQLEAPLPLPAPAPGPPAEFPEVTGDSEDSASGLP